LNESQAGVALPLIGFKQPPSEGVQGEIEQKLLETEKITPQNFRVSFMPEISAPGNLRAILTSVHRFSLETPSKESQNPSEHKTLLGFTLHKGSYATVLLREFMKPSDLINAGY
jgi:tRNA pseudouridine13 synthase